ncbi:helicase [Paenibacillus protaetiae]|uniref:Helicase n=2 Tax=Paenibacillus protaetiae TaxID=2509456 RepID=A0A4P6F5C8_9BACL|nr:RNA polymerase recycling motor HelD [Paenibacillus protaetiae]QAY68407.1 helicase [Paenibacillus protaetiae]
MQDEQQIEQQRVDRVTAHIKRKIETLQEQVGDKRGDVVEIRRDFWDDVTVNFEDSAEAAETAASLKQQAEVLFEREHSHRHARKQLLTMRKLEQSPYFGRIDFKENGETQAEQVYLGIGSLLDENEEQYLIYDWRAPVSSLYYDYSPGPAQYKTPVGTIEGEMTLKRQFVIRGGRIRSMFEIGVTIGDEVLQEVLGRHSDAQMKGIVATIQQEQNTIIRNERARLLVVQGAAGSGKTSAALQRAAYLLYRYRGQLAADQIVLFSPNPMFNSYVATVLPELGEENMQQTTYQHYLEHRLGRSFELEDPFTQMEYTLSGMADSQYEARVAAIRFKSDVPFMRIIERYAKSLGEAGIKFRPIRFRGSVLISSEEMSRRFYELDRTLSIANRLKLLSEWMLKELTALGKLERKKSWVEEEIELMDKEQYIHAYNELMRKKGFTSESFDDFEREKEMLASMLVQQKFKKLRSSVKRYRFLDIPKMYRALFEKPHWTADGQEQLPAEWADICTITSAKLENGELYYEDATPLLYLKELLEGFHTNTQVQHVFIDEAQDYSAFQFHYLKRIFPRAKMTVLGDLNQAIFAHAEPMDSFAMLKGLYGYEEMETVVLARSYRSTRPIVEFTSRMIPGGSRIIPFNRDGEQPLVAQACSAEELVRKVSGSLRGWKAQGLNALAVICKTAAEAKAAAGMLRETGMEVRLVEKETVTFEQGIVVIPSYLAKGVEFDAVAIFNASQEVYGRESERKLFYTACTRAMHELHVYYTGELTPLISV